MNPIFENLFISDISFLDDLELLKKNKITHILSCCELPEKSDSVLKEFNHKMIKIFDMGTEDISKYFEESIDFITKGREKGAGTNFLFT